MSTATGTSSEFQFGKEAFAATKEWFIATAIIWAIFLGINFIWNPQSDSFGVCWLLFGFLGPVAMLFSSTRALFRMRSYAEEGVGIRRYVPMFVHRGGLNLPHGNSIEYVAALASANELILFSCEESLCKSMQTDFFSGLKKEVARFPFQAIENVYIYSPEIDKSDRLAKQIGEFIGNRITSSLLHRSYKTVYFDSFVIVALSGTNKDPLIFGIPDKLSGFPLFDLVLGTLPEAVSGPLEKMGTAQEVLETLTVEEEDPRAVKTAKQLALQLLTAKATGKLRV